MLTDFQDKTSVEYAKFRIFRKFDTRDVNIRGESKKVTDMLIKDAAGNEGKLTIWGDDADKYNENDVVELKDGWCKIWNEQIQLSKGRKGTITIVDDDPAIPE